MPEKRYIQPPGFGELPGPMARGLVVGKTLYITGTTAISHLAGDYFERPISSSFEEQAVLTMENIKRVVEAAGGSMKNVVRTLVILKRQKDFGAFNTIRARYFPSEPPASCTFSANLIRDDVLIEIQAEAILD